MNENPRRSIPWLRVGLCFFIVIAFGLGGGNATAEDGEWPGMHNLVQSAKAQARFVVIERIARLPATEQAQKIPELYKEIAWPILNACEEFRFRAMRDNILDPATKRRGNSFGHFDMSLANRWAAQLTAAQKDLTPEEMANRIGMSYMFLNGAAWSRTIVLLEAHPKITASLIDADLRSDDALIVRRALDALRCLRWQQYNPRVLELLWSENKEIHGFASDYLAESPDNFVKEKLLEKLRADPRSIERSGAIFYSLLAGRTVEPAVLALLESPDDKIRERAAWAVRHCLDPAIGPHAARLASDANAQTRLAVANMIFSLPEETFKSIRNQLLPLLKDENLDVRYLAAYGFAQRRDVVAGPVILHALKQPLTDEQYQGNISLALLEFEEMAERRFVYPQTEWGPANARNKKTIEEFERWLSERGLQVAP